MSDTPKSDAAIKQWPIYTEEVFSRLDGGRQSYGDSSFECPLMKLATEIQMETTDISGWGFVLWQRVEALKPKIAELERLLAERSMAA